MFKRLLLSITLALSLVVPSFAYQRGDLLAQTKDLKFFFLDKEQTFGHQQVRIVVIDSHPGVAGNTAPALKIVQSYQVSCGDGLSTGFHYGFMGEVGFFHPNGTLAWQDSSGEGYFGDADRATASWIPFVLRKAGC